MSFLEFPPLGQEERPYALHEMNGRVAYGSAEEVEVVSKSGLLCDYPKVDKKQLQTLQHSMSRESVRRVFNERESNRFQQAVDVWQRNGTRGLLEFMGNVCEGSRFAWPLTGAVRLLRKAEEEVRGAFMLSEEKICDMIAGVSTNLNWKSNWIRCLAFHDDGHCLAICQPSDHIRIYSVGAVSRTPITLKHIRQKNVAQMAWKPFDAMVLAVACEDAVLVWRLNPKALTSRPPAQCAQVLEVGASFSPVTQCIWDHILSSAVFIVSPSSSRLLIIDTTTGESESVGGWIGPRIRRIWSSPDHSKLLVSYYSDTIRVYDRSCWEEEKWTGLFGGCVAAVWSPDCSCLLFSNHDRPSIYSIRFANRIEQNADKQHILRSYGADTPIEVFNLSEGSCEEEGEERMRVVGGRVHDMQLSADGKRLAVAFKENPSVIALFIADWLPSVLLTPCSLIEGASYGDAAIISFCPKFTNGSLLSVVWTAGRLQYIPLVYGHSTNTYADSTLFLSMSSDSLSSPREMLFEQRLPQEQGSTRKGNELSMRQVGVDEANEEIQLFSTSTLFDQLLLNCSEGGKQNVTSIA